MTSLIQQIGRLAIRTFKREPRVPESVFNSQYEQLYTLVNKITPEDINLDPRLLDDHGQPYRASSGDAPVTYMQVYEDTDVTICVFILKRGVRLPLHDHPGMYGMLKVIHGSVSVQSYSHMAPELLQEGLQELLDVQRLDGLRPATKHQCVHVSSGDVACRLTPNSKNVHEICAVDGPAAFLDILSPPYGPDKKLGIERECHYYEEFEAFRGPHLANNDLTFLINIPSPSEFWCDQSKYIGPVIDQHLEENGS